ncbi:hypothetical protein EYW49_13105 [Siculibacillus lacustris]|uniref:Flavoprotein domain-containing protein n=1 Tax=Siculibacillus lacustris TaxID=1549641 RepID=A0A4Q9VMP5_9HYPH|nr:flavoprotein [Siculibacillus lacustris]TBW36774.1 hypothetical protein EYW49_13105 [Siculibacillus lacustris]
MDDPIVDKVVARVLALLAGETIDPGRRNVFVLFSGAVSGFAAGREAVSRLVRSHHQLTIMLTPSARKIFGEGPLRELGAAAIVDFEPWVDVSEHVRRADLVLVPTLTMNLAGRLALGSMDTPAATLILGALLAGKAVLAIRDGADPAGKRGEALGAIPEGSPALWALLEDRLATLERFGVELVAKDAFLVAMERRLVARRRRDAVPAAIASGPVAVVERERRASPIVTAGELIGAAPGSRFRLAAGCRLTAQAEETARSLGLRLEFV